MLVTLPSAKDQEEDIQPTTSHASLHKWHSASMDKKHMRSSSWTQTSPYATRDMRRDIWGVFGLLMAFFCFRPTWPSWHGWFYPSIGPTSASRLICCIAWMSHFIPSVWLAAHEAKGRVDSYTPCLVGLIAS
jgi:hypothetical protein